MKYPLKCLALFIFLLDISHSVYSQQNEKHLKKDNAKEFSLAEYLKENTEEAGIRYQAYLRVRLTVNQDSLQYLLPHEVEKIKAEIAQNKTDYTKLVYSESESPARGKDEIVAKNIEPEEKSDDETKNPASPRL